MAVKHLLQSSIYRVLKHNKDGSFATQTARKYILYQMAGDLVKGGYQLRDIRGFKTKHVRYLVEHWKSTGIMPGTLKNRLSALNWLADKLNKPNLVPSTKELAIPKRKYVTNIDKSIQLLPAQFNNITDKGIQLSLQLERAFGLRREEALKIKPYLADQGTVLKLQGSWCKNGRPREIPICTEEQRELLARCKTHVGSRNRSMIAVDKSYVQHLRLYEFQLQQAGIHRAHGLRHAYAQARYFELTGWACPAAGGPKVKELTTEQKEIDLYARRMISHDLGHSRIQITSIYCGR